MPGKYFDELEVGMKYKHGRRAEDSDWRLVLPKVSKD